VVTTGATVSGPDFPALLHAPGGAGVPVISSPSAVVGAALSCSHGTWAPDLLPSFDYHAPQRFAYGWSKNGVPIAGAATSSITAASPGSYSCQVSASNSAGSAVQSSAAFAVKAGSGGTGGSGGGGSGGGGSGGGGSGGATVPVASNLSISPSAFRAAASGPTATATKAKAHPGAKVSYTLNLAATVRFTVAQRVRGRTVGHGKTARCTAQTKANRKAHVCTLTVTLPGFFAQTGKVGTNSLHFSGRLNGHKLKPGTYTLVATPTAGAKTGSAVSIAFRIIR
jgi:hypothetical protein